MIDGIEFPSDAGGTEVRIELTEGRLVPATLRWAADGKAGIEFDRPVNLDQLNTPKPKTLRR
jgi:hypothetical protein